MRYVMRIAKPSESSKFWTQLALPCEACLLECLFYPHRTYIIVCFRRRLSMGIFSIPIVMLRWNTISLVGSSRLKTWPGICQLSLTTEEETTHSVTWFYTKFFPRTKQKHTLSSSFGIGPPIRQDYPLNLSILISGGKETNQDSPSNCEWSGRSSDWKSSEL